MENHIIKPRNKTISSYEDILDFQNNPFIFVDVGAAGNIMNQWKQISKNSILIVFEPDKRSFPALKSRLKSFGKVYLQVFFQ